MIAKKEIEKLPVIPAEAEENDRFIGRIRMHGETLVMDVYEAGMMNCSKGEEKEAEISFRWVCDKKNYFTYIFQKAEWTNQGMYCAMHGVPGWYVDDEIRLDKKSRKIAEDFLKDLGKKFWSYRSSVTGRLSGLEEHIRDKRRDRAYDLRQERLNARVARREPLPKDWDDWLRKNVFKENRYIFYDAKDRKHGTCAYCGNEIELDGKQKHNVSGRCPECGSRIQYKAIGKSGGRIQDNKQAVYLQKTEDGFLTRYFFVKKTSSKNGEYYRSSECTLATYNGEKTWYDYCVISEYSGGECWLDGKPACMNSWEAEGYLYTKNVKRVLEDTQFRYAPLTIWMKHEKKSIPLCDFLVKFQRNPFLEFFVKAGLWRLTREYVREHYNWSGNTPQEVLGINRQRISRLIRLDGGINILDWLRYEETENCRISDEMMEWLDVNKVNVNTCREILNELQSVTRMVNYMKKQKVSPNKVLEYWSDYLRMARQEGLDTTDDIIRFPKDLKRRHDQLADRINARNDRKRREAEADKYNRLNSEILSHLPEAKRFFWEDETYMMIPAGTCEELMEEGRTLHHCVGASDTYMNRMAEGRSWILFLRKKAELEKPHYTIEIDMKTDEILQWYSEYDRKPDKEEIRKVLNKFKSAVKRKRARVPADAAAEEIDMPLLEAAI